MSGYELVAAIVACATLLVLAWLGVRLVNGNPHRVSRVGFFVERQRFEDWPGEADDTRVLPPR
jgi:hypothetical protein